MPSRARNERRIRVQRLVRALHSKSGLRPTLCLWSIPTGFGGMIGGFTRLMQSKVRGTAGNHHDCFTRTARYTTQRNSMNTQPCKHCNGNGLSGHYCESRDGSCSCVDPKDNLPCRHCQGTRAGSSDLISKNRETCQPDSNNTRRASHG